MNSKPRYERYTCPQCGLMLPIIRDNGLFGNLIVLEEDSFAEHLLQLLDETGMRIEMLERENAILRGTVDVAAKREIEKDNRIEELERHECPCHDGKGYASCVAFRHCDDVTKELADRQMHELAKRVVAESMPIYESIEDARTRRIADLEELIADMRGEMRPFERDVFLLRYIDKRIAELGIEV